MLVQDNFLSTRLRREFTEVLKFSVLQCFFFSSNGNCAFHGSCKCHVILHLDQCGEKVVQCTISGCHAILRSKNFDDHVVTAAPSHMVLQAGEVQRLKEFSTTRLANFSCHYRIWLRKCLLCVARCDLCICQSKLCPSPPLPVTVGHYTTLFIPGIGYLPSIQLPGAFGHLTSFTFQHCSFFSYTPR